MSTKYRVKLANGRIVGPLVEAQIAELFAKGHLRGNEDCQVFPTGDWKKINTFQALVSKLSKKNHEEETRHDSTVLKLNILNDLLNEKKKKEAEASPAPVAPPPAPKKEKPKEQKKEETEQSSAVEFREFKFSRNTESAIDYSDIRKKHEEEEKASPAPVIEEDDEEDKTRKQDPVEIPPAPEVDDNLEKTVILNRPVKAPQKTTIDKTVIVNPQALAKLKEPSVKVTAPEDLTHTKKEITKQSEVINTSDKTEFISLATALPALKREAKMVEKQIEEELALPMEIDEEEDDDEDFNEETTSRLQEVKKKGMKPIVAFAFIVVLYFLLFEEEEKPKTIDPKKVHLNFPIANEYEDLLKSEKAYEKGMELYMKGTYVAKALSTLEFRNSLSHKFNDNSALGMTILVYAELFENAENSEKAAQNLHRMIQITRGKVLTDINVALGTAIFYYKFGKPHAAVNILENFLRVKQPSVKMLAYYLNFLMTSGNFAQARVVFDSLVNAPQKPLEAFVFMAKFHEYNERFEEGKAVILEGGKVYPNSVWLLLDYCEYLLREERIEELEQVLAQIFELQAEQSPTYFARYLEYKGMIAAYRKDVQLAAKFFKQALELNESSTLRSKLATLEVGGGTGTEKLILESKVIQLINKSKQAEVDGNWELAFKFAIEASDMMDRYIPAELHLARIQIKRGYYESAIKTLQALKAEHYLDPEINFYLISGLIDAFKLDEAQRLIQLLAQNHFAATPEYSSLLARYYAKSKNYNLAVRNFVEAIKRNPLNDENYYLLGSLYLEVKRYNEAKNYLMQAIELDPTNVKYRSAYGQILYDLSGPDTAIGYLRDYLETNKDNPKILSDIAIYYYRSGQVKSFERYKEIIEKLPNKDETFYEFLIRTSKLENNMSKFLEYSEELLKVNPGNLEARMSLGENYMTLKRYSDAIRMFESVKDRLASYPKVHFQLALVYLEMKDLNKALVNAEEEIKQNPTLEMGYYALGETYRRMEKPTEATRALERSISINGRYVPALMALGWIKHYQNYLEPARELYLRALREDASIPEIHKELGLIHKGLGAATLAIESLTVYLNLKPNAPDKSQIEALIRQLK